MAVVTINAPDPSIDLDLVKQHLRVESDEEDLLIGAYVAAAWAHIDGVGAYLGRAIAVQTLEWRTVLAASGCMPLPYGPASAVSEFKYADGVGGWVDLAEERFSFEDGVLTWTDAPWSPGAQVRVRYVTGLEAPPPSIVAAVLLMTGDLYANRETAVVGLTAIAIPMSTTVENLLRPFRVLEV